VTTHATVEGRAIDHLDLRGSYGDAARIRVAERTFARRTEETTARHGLTPQRYLLLLLIKVASEEGSEATVTSLGRLLQTTQSSVTQLVRGAEAAGLLHRVSDARDARRQHLYLTEDGARRLAAAFSELGDDRVELARAISHGVDENAADRLFPSRALLEKH
jgi:DNA-binding MarR family transcriptional regulator